jgi:hypothetical protein
LEKEESEEKYKQYVKTIDDINNLHIKLIFLLAKEFQPSYNLAIALMTAGTNLCISNGLTREDILKRFESLLNVLFTPGETTLMSEEDVIRKAQASGASVEEIANLIEVTSNFKSDKITH